MNDPRWSRDIVMEAMQSALRHLDDEVEKGGWDQPPVLVAIHRAIDFDATGAAVALRFTPINTGDILINQHPSDALAMIAKVVARGTRPPMPEGLFAFAFVCETWMVMQGSADDDAVRDVIGAAHKRQLHTHPNRIEGRTISAVDLAGIRYSHVRPRDLTANSRIETAGRASEAADAPFMDGYVHNSLAVLIETLG